MYLNHIQILRAISVLLVFFFHSNLNFFSNGYLGVDMFFVISGFVITKMLEEKYFLNQKYKFKQFYIKRILRIAPAYFFMIATFVIFFVFIGPLTDFDYIINKILHLITFTTNFFYIYYNKEYFENISQDPLNHTWSLAVEIQFYFFFPFIIYLLKKNFYQYSIKKILTGIIIFGIFFTFLYSKNINLTFYSPIFRSWEFFLGSLSYYLQTENKSYKNENNLLIILGALFFIIILFSPLENRYLNLILITLLTFLFLTFVKNHNRSNFILNNHTFLHLGNISYSFYLWHLPILYFFNTYFSEKFMLIFAFLITFVFSHFSYIYIEKKFKNFKINKKFYLILITFISIVLSIFILKINYLNIKNLIIKYNFLEKKYSLTKRINYTEIKINNNEIYKFCTKESKKFTLNDFLLRNECLKFTDTDTLIYVEGDSHTAMILPLILSYKNFKNIYYSHNSSYSYKEVNYQLKNFKNIIYITSINSLDKLEYLKNNIKNLDNQIIKLIFAPVPNHYNDKIRSIHCLIQNKDCLFDVEQDYRIRNLNLISKKINKLQVSLNNIFFFDPYKILCPLKKCYIYDAANKRLNYRDGTHLTIEGSLVLKEKFDLFLSKKFNFNPL